VACLWGESVQSRVESLRGLGPSVGVARWSRAWAVFAPLFVGMVLAPPARSLAAQETGVVVGRVFDGLRGAAIPGAVVSVHGSDQQLETDSAGNFEFLAMPPGLTVLRAEAVGYSGVVETVSVRPMTLTRLRFDLWPVAFALEDITVAARRRLAAAGADTTRPASEERPSTYTATDLLRETAPGVFVLIPNGYLDSSASVLVRGIKSVTMSSAPVVYVDGIRVSGEVRESSMPGGRGLSILDQLSASEIAEIRLLRGPAATIEYPEATNGVILIRTKGSGRERSGE